MGTVFCIGELLIDFVAENQGSDLSKALTFTKKAGGAPANVACAISKLGGDASFIGCVGWDPFGSFLLNVLQNEGVDTSMAQRSKEFTTLAFVSIDEEGERDFVFSRGADLELQYDPSVKKEFQKNLVHFGAATALLGGTLEKAYGHYLFDALTQDSFISFDPNFRADLWKENEAIFIKKCLPFVEKSHLSKFSLDEAQLLSGKKGLEEAAAFLHEVGAKIIAITLGSKGTFISTGKRQGIVESFKVDAIDTTGAGDAFIGCLLYQISQMRDFTQLFNDFDLLLQMVAKANKAGAITTTKFGAIVALPKLEEIEN